MARVNFGGQQDLSGVFEGLLQAQERRIESASERALARVEADEAARDQEVYADWTAGNISDEEWLAYIRKRIADSAGDPEEHTKWRETLLEHEGAIKDAQAETNFQLGKISAKQLMAHYQRRMKGVETNSPAWRELAGRFAEIQDYANQVARSGGGGGGGGGGGSSKSGASVGAVVGSGEAARLSGGSSRNYSTEGPDVINPIAALFGFDDADGYVAALKGDIDRLTDMTNQYLENPDGRIVDRTTGEEFDRTPELGRAIANQYIRTEYAIAAADIADGGDGSQALGYAGKYIAGPLREMNSNNIKPVWREAEQNIVTRMQAASVIVDPGARAVAYRSLYDDVNTLEEGLLRRTVGKTRMLEGADDRNEGEKTVTAALPEELQPDKDIYDAVAAVKLVLEVGANPMAFDEDRANDQYDRALGLASSLGDEGSSFSLKKMIEGEFVDDRSVMKGVAETRDELIGLRLGADPNYTGPRYTYAYSPDTGLRLAEAEMRTDPTPDGGLTQRMVPIGADPDQLVQAAVKVGGTTRMIWTEARPSNDPRFQVYQLTEDFGKWDKGDFLPSSEIQKLGKAGLQGLVRRGVVEKASAVDVVEIPDQKTGRVTAWFRDNDTGTFFQAVEQFSDYEVDPITGGLMVENDGEAVMTFKPYANGVVMPFAGISGKQMQAFVIDNVDDLVLSNYSMRGPDGNVLQEAPSLEGMYWSIEDEPLGPSLSQLRGRIRPPEQTVAERRESQRERQAKAWVRENLSSMEQARWRHNDVDPTEWAAERLRQFGSDMGINTGGDILGPAEKRKVAVREARGFDPRANVRQAALAAVNSRATRQKLDAIKRTAPLMRPAPVQRARIEAPDPVRPALPIVPARQTVERIVNDSAPSTTRGGTRIDRPGGRGLTEY